MKIWKKKGFNYLFLILLTVIVLYFSLKDDFNSIVNELLHINVLWILYAFLLMFGYWFFRSLVLKRYTSRFRKGARFLNSFQLTMRTQFFNAVTPFATGGQPYQIYYLSQEGIKVSSSTSIIMQNFIVYQIALVSLGVMAVIANKLLHFYPKVALLGRLVTIGFIANTLVVIIMFLVAFNRKINEWLIKFGLWFLTKIHIIKDKAKKEKEWTDFANSFHDGAVQLLKNRGDFLYGIGMNFIALISLYLIPLTILYATGGNDFNALEAIVTSAYVMLLGSFVPMPGGTGGLEYGFIAFYGNFLSGSQLTAIMLLWRFVTYYLGIILGAIALNIKRVK